MSSGTYYATLAQCRAISEMSIRRVLIDAGEEKDMGAINACTDVLAERGLVRPRHDDSRLEELKREVAGRPVREVVSYRDRDAAARKSPRCAA